MKRWGKHYFIFFGLSLRGSARKVKECFVHWQKKAVSVVVHLSKKKFQSSKVSSLQGANRVAVNY